MRKIKKAILLAVCFSMLLSLSACGSQNKKAIGTCAGYDVLYEELRYVTLTYKDMFAATYGETIWDTPESAEQYRAELEETVWRMMLNNYAVLAACNLYGGRTAEDMNSDAIQDAVDEQMEEAIEAYGGKSAFKKQLKAFHMTENFMRFCLSVAQMENELYYDLTTNLGLINNDLDKFMDWLDEGNCVYVQHICIRNDAGDDKEANRATAESIRQQLLNGADLNSMVASSTNEETTYLNPYYIVRDVYVEEMENAAFALQNVGDVSEVVDTGDAYYILVRVQDSTAKLLTESENLFSSWQWAKVEDYVNGCKANLKIELNEFGKSIDLLEIK